MPPTTRPSGGRLFSRRSLSAFSRSEHDANVHSHVEHRDISDPSTSIATRTLPDDANPPVYTPPINLHASLVYPSVDPVPTSITLASGHVRGHIRNPEIALIVAAIISSMIVGLMVLSMTRSIWRPNFRGPWTSLRCQRVKRDSNAARSLEKIGSRSDTNREFDDSTWGTPTQRKAFERESKRQANQVTSEPLIPAPQSSPQTTPASTSIPHNQLPLLTRVAEANNNKGWSEDEFAGRLQVEEADIALALDIAYRDYTPPEALQKYQHSTSISVDLGQDISAMRCQQAGVKRVENDDGDQGVRNRPRQGSDASSSSRDTTTTQIIEPFPSQNSCRSSMTSVASWDSEMDGEDATETEYEVRRAQTRSLEIKKGVLISWKNAEEESIDDTPNIVVSDSESLPSFTAFPDHSQGTISSIVADISTTTMAEARRKEDGHFLHTQVPYLMVTRPSTTSLLTLDSSLSSRSIDLNDFPLPPSTIDSALSILVDQIHSQKHVWDNHSADSTVAEKRSTVEQFIMMYETA